MNNHKLIIFREKYDNSYFIFDAGNADQLLTIFQKVFGERNQQGWYNVPIDDEYQHKMYRLADAGNREAVLAFMEARREHEYEGFEIITPDSC